MKPATSVTMVLMIAISLLHLARLISGTQVVAGEFTVPSWMSAVAVVLTGGLAFGLWREHRSTV